MLESEALSKLLNVLKTCPTCGTALIAIKGTTILRCPDLYHGRFVIERTARGNFFITYEPKPRSLTA